MALFVGLVTEEVLEAVMPGGALYRWRRTLLPVVAAVGGVLVWATHPRASGFARWGPTRPSKASISREPTWASAE